MSAVLAPEHAARVPEQRRRQVAAGATARVGHLRHVPGLDGLRGLAVAAVLIYHADHLKGGYLGVDLFFVLSGYLITTILLDEWTTTGSISLSRFWARRARRLFPALMVVLVGVAGYALLFARPFELGQIRGDGLATLWYVANWHAVFTSQDYWRISLSPSPLQHTWSLAIEEQFYLLWPLVVAGLLRWRRQVGTVLVATTTLAAVSALLMVGLHAGGTSTSRLYYGTDTRAAAILFGAAFAAWRSWRGDRTQGTDPRHRPRLEFAAIGGLLVLGLSWQGFDGQSSWLYGGGLALCGLAVIPVIASVTHPEVGMVSQVLSAAPLRGLGLISYGVYLWHWPLYLVLDADRTGVDGWALVGIRVGATLGVALLSYVLVEQPIRRGGLPGRVGVMAIPVTAAITCFALVVATSGAEPAADANSVSVKGAGWRYAAEPGAPKVLVVGDSVATSLLNAATNLRDEVGASVANGTHIGCGPIYGLGDIKDVNSGEITSGTSCGDSWGADTRALRPDVVLVVIGYPPVTPVKINGEFRRACEPTYDQALERTFARQLREVEDAGARVLLATIPRSHAIQYIDAGSEAAVGCANRVLRKLADASDAVDIAELGDFLCPPGQGCPTEIGGIKVREDNLHFRAADGPLVARWLLPQAVEMARRR